MNAWIGLHRGPVAAALFALTLGLLGATLTDPGITWDEPHYFASARLQARWVDTLVRQGPAIALERETVFEMWDWDHYHNPHPPVYKEGMALTWRATRGFASPLFGFRLFPALLFSAMVTAAFLWATAAWGGVAGVGAALAILLSPRLFGHAHIGATETPLAVFWFLTTAAGWWAVERRRSAGWVVAGIGWGLAAGTKFTGLVVGVPVLAWALWRAPRKALKGGTLAGVVMIVVFFLLNPMLWVDPGSFLGTWFWESLHREAYAPISTFYQGLLYGFDVPWHHVFVMTAAVTPLGILALAGVGVAVGLRRVEPAALLALGVVVFVWLLMLTPRAPHHNGIRQFISLFPFLGMLAGYGLKWTGDRSGPSGMALVAALVFVPAAAGLARSHPFYLSYYGEAVGGLAGADARGFERTYWMDAVTVEVLNWMNRELPEDASVHVLGQPLALQLNQAYGRARPDLRFVDDPSAEYYLIPMNDFVIGDALRESIRHANPLFEVRRDGVPLVAIYRPEGGDDDVS